MTDTEEKTPPGLNEPEVTILSDHAAEEVIGGEQDPLEDLLGLDGRLVTVLDILRHRETRCPLSIAIYGDWGTGKTSAMRWLAKQLTLWNGQSNFRKIGHPKVYPVWFDPWKYRTREDVWRGLISEVILHCISVSELDIENVLSRMSKAAKQMGRFLGRSFLHAMSQVKFGVGVEVSGQTMRDILDEWQKTNRPDKAFLNEFESEIKYWVSEFLPQTEAPDGKGAYNDRIVLFIDDLDRCLPDVTLEVLEALKLYLNVPNLVFVVGLDRSVVDSVVLKHYTELGVEGPKSRQYLNKMFQVELDVPPAEPAISKFFEAQIKELDRVTRGLWSKKLEHAGSVEIIGGKKSVKDVIHGAISRLGSTNPRELKRLLNSTLLRARTAMMDRKLGGKSDALRFAQGAQSYLLQRMIRDQFVGEEAAVRRNVT